MSSIDLSADLKLARLELEVAEAKYQLAIEANVQNIRDMEAKDKRIAELEAKLGSADTQIGILASNYGYYKSLYYAEAKKAATLSDALGNAKRLLEAQETMARHADSEPTLEGVFTDAIVTGLKAGIGDSGRAAEAIIHHPVGTKIPPRTCMYCGEGQMVGAIVVASKPNEGDYHLDPAVCRHWLLEYGKALRSRIFDLEGEIAGFKNFELPEKDKHIANLQTQLEALRKDMDWFREDRDSWQKRALDAERALEADRKERHDVLVVNIQLPTDQASWDKAAPWINQALFRYKHIGPR